MLVVIYFIKMKELFTAVNYFSYLPYEKKILTYKKCFKELSNQIEKIIKKL